MEVILVLAIAFSFALGACLTYWLFRFQFNHKKKEHLENIHKTIENLEKNHQSRMQLSIKSLQENYENQQKQAIELLEKKFDIKTMKLKQEIEEDAKEKALLNFQLEKNHLESSFEEKYKLEFNKWKIQYEKSIRRSSLTASRNAIKGSISEQMLPLLPGLKYSPGDMRFISMPIDYIIFDGYGEVKETGGEIRSIILADVKRGSAARLSPIQEKIKAAVDAGRVRWETIEISDNLKISISTNNYQEKQVRCDSDLLDYSDSINDKSKFFAQKPYDLCQKILAWGNSRNLDYISNLTICCNHSDSNVRRLTASAIGKIASSNSAIPAIELAIPALGKLTLDEKPQVRQYAVKALGLINSQKVLPFLQQSLKDPIGYVSAAADIALKKLDLQL